ncbi:hypothetical protein [Sphingobium boeckii]|uniref:Uncharacterized protein n=1 Tax=Sphingobium boeckii TaxID=1082345 RepID=A0A7W9ECI4_9SPHN|nr:hypothetical protein [Sphingobium boeckii]MBB5684303.1 hypothetical protein [Sphingobium boeckii]
MALEPVITTTAGDPLAGLDLGVKGLALANLIADWAGENILGDLTASPNALSIAGRLKSIVDNVDGLEALIGSTNTLLTTQNGFVDGLEALVAATNAALTTGNANTDTLETLIGALNGYVDGLEALSSAMSAKLPATLGAKTAALSMSMAPASDAVFAVGMAGSTTGTTSTVEGAAASTTLLAANANRMGGSIVNESTAICYILLGSGTASATNYSYAIDGMGTSAVGGIFEIPDDWKGIVKGYWASATGNARVTERTA